MQRFVTNDIERLVMEALVSASATDREAIESLYARVDDAGLFAFAQRNEVASVVGKRLMQVVGETQLPDRWRKAYQAVADKIGRFMDELDRVAERFAREGIDLVALKNSGIARALYPDPGENPMGDLDVLVRRDRFVDAHRILESEGYQFDFRVPDTIEEEGVEEGLLSGGCEYGKDLAGGTRLFFELQWRPVSGRWIRPDAEPRGDDLVARSVPLDDSHVRILAPNDNLLQVCLHTAKHTFVRAPGMRLHTDVDRIVRHQPGIDWERFVRDVEALGLRTAVYFSLAIPHALMRTPVPDRVLHRLEPSTARRDLMLAWLRDAGFFNPDENKFSRAGYIAFVMLLFDDVRGLSRGILPEYDFMQRQYGLTSPAQLPIAWTRRIWDLTFRRVKQV